jgi:hypothetical protein
MLPTGTTGRYRGWKVKSGSEWANSGIFLSVKIYLFMKFVTLASKIQSRKHTAYVRSVGGSCEQKKHDPVPRVVLSQREKPFLVRATLRP